MKSHLPYVGRCILLTNADLASSQSTQVRLLSLVDYSEHTHDDFKCNFSASSTVASAVAPTACKWYVIAK